MAYVPPTTPPTESVPMTSLVVKNTFLTFLDGSEQASPTARRARSEMPPSRMLKCAGSGETQLRRLTEIMITAPGSPTSEVGLVSPTKAGVQKVESGMSLSTFMPDSASDEEREEEKWQQGYRGSRPPLSQRTHGMVPRNVKLAEEYSHSEKATTPPTTLMIRNIPNRYNQRELISEMEDLGFRGTWDFFYAPVDKGTFANVGYAFVNFISHKYAAKAMQVFTYYSFKKYQRTHRKIATVSIAHLQGLEANVRHYENAAVNSSKLRQCRPVIIASPSRSRFFDDQSDEAEMEASWR